MANAAAFQLGWQAATDRQQRKQQLADEDRKNKFADLHEQRLSLRDQLVALSKAQVAETDPRYVKAKDQLNDTQTQIDLLFHPVHAPGALERNWDFIQGVVNRKILRRKPQTAQAAQAPAAVSKAPDGTVAVNEDALHPALSSEDPFKPDFGIPETWQRTTTAAMNAAGSPTPAQQKPPPQPAQAQPPARPQQQPKQGRYERQMQAARDKAAKEAQAYLAAGMGLTPEEEASVAVRGKRAVANQTAEAARQTYRDLGLPQEGEEAFVKEAAMSAWGIKSPAGTGKWEHVTATDANGEVVPLLFNQGRYYQNDGVTPLTGEEIAALKDFKYGAAKPVRKQATRAIQTTKGWVQIWVDPTDPGNRSLWSFTPTTPPRGLQMSQSESATTDPLTGLVTRNLRRSGPVGMQIFDLSDMRQATAADLGEGTAVDAASAPPAPQPAAPGAATPAAPQTQRGGAAMPTAVSPRQLKQQVPSQPVVTNPNAPVGSYENPLPLNAQGEIPIEARPANLNEQQWELQRTQANRLLAGASAKELGGNYKLSSLAQSLAERYGWSPQGLFSPKDKLMIREAGTYLKSMRDDTDLSVLEDYWSRQKIHNAIVASDNNGGFFSTQMALALKLNPAEADFVQKFLQVRGTVSGLSQLTRGGRTTEAGIKRLQSELPDPLTVHSAEDAKTRLDRLLSEIDVAQQQGFIAETTDKQDRSPLSTLQRLFGGAPGGGAAPPPAAGGLQVGTVLVNRQTGERRRYKGGPADKPTSYEVLPNAPAGR